MPSESDHIVTGNAPCTDYLRHDLFPVIMTLSSIHGCVWLSCRIEIDLAAIFDQHRADQLGGIFRALAHHLLYSAQYDIMGGVWSLEVFFVDVA